MYRPRQYSNVYSNSTWRKPAHVPFQTSAIESSSIDPTLLLERNIYDGLLPNSIGVIKTPDDESAEDLEITNFVCIGSYSWIEAAKGTPTILVPGSPPQWRNRSPPFQVFKPDQGPRIIDQDGFRTSSGRIGYLLPIFAAVTHNQEMKEGPPFDWSSVDIVADRSALRKLIRWANNKLVFNQKIRKSDKLFRLDLQLAGKKTVLINRVSLKYAEEHLYQTYREGFGRAAMAPAPGCRNALDYHRVVTYDLNGLKMLVRCEVDAYDPGATNGDQVEELSGTLQATSIQSPTNLRRQGLTGITIKSAGKEVPQAGLLELGTRWVQNKFPMDWSETYTQLFLSQIPKHVIAHQDNGVFTKIEERRLDSAPELEAAKTDAKARMNKLVKILERIRELVMKEGKDSRLSLVSVYGALRVYKRRSQESCLPDDVLALFE